MEILKLAQINKTYKSGFNLQKLDLHINPGENLALLGANGAGKSTLMNIITGNTWPNHGTVTLKTQKLTPQTPELRRQLGYLSQNLDLPPWVSAWELLHYAADLHQIPEPSSLIKTKMQFWDCDSYCHQAIDLCSHGMKKRIGLCLATLHEPDLLILDEPFSGLDIFHIKSLEQELENRRQKQQSTLLSTHIIPYAATICSRSYFIKNGELSHIQTWQTSSTSERIKLSEGFFFT